MGFFKKNTVFFVLAIAFFGVLAFLTGAFSSLNKVRLFFVVLACISFVLSIVLWVFCWALLLKKSAKASFFDLGLVAFASLSGSLTPIQAGSDALRSIFLKKRFNLDYSSSVQASFIVKGLKFAILSLMIFLLLSVNLIFFINAHQWFSLQDYFNLLGSFFFFMTSQGNLFFVAAFLSGVLIVFLGSTLFLLPLKKSFAKKASSFFSVFSNKHVFFVRGKNFFASYPKFFEKTNFFELFFISSIVLMSWVFELFALFFSFLALNASIPIYSIFSLFVLTAILERVPFLPRGIGLVEFASFYFLSFPQFFPGFFLDGSIIGAILVVFGIARILVPTLFGFVFFFYISHYFKHDNPKQAIEKND